MTPDTVAGSSDARARYVLHVGLPKTGTSFLQSVLRQNRAALRESGVLFPSFGTRGRLLAALDGRDRHRYAGVEQPAEGHWQRFVDSTRAFDGTVVFSHEVLGAPLADSTPTALAGLQGHSADVVITARDPARQLMSVWQQGLRFRSQATFDEFLAECDLEPRGTYRHGHFRDQQLDRVVRAWQQHLPADRIHVVTVPPSGSATSLLWARFCAVIGIDPTLYEMPDQRVINPSLGVVQAEYLRRVNAAMGERVRPRDYSKIRKFVISAILEHTEPSPKPVLPERSFDTAAEVADRWIDTLRTGGFDVVGDLNDLRPVRAQSPGPDDWTEADVASVSVAAGAEVMIALARTKGALGEE